MKTVKVDDELRPEYKRSDFSALVRGKYAGTIAEDDEVVPEAEVAKDQHDDRDVQEQQETGSLDGLLRLTF